jgi:hypothetical protein
MYIPCDLDVVIIIGIHIMINLLRHSNEVVLVYWILGCNYVFWNKLFWHSNDVCMVCFWKKFVFLPT